jgi:RNA polymerase-binding transcription factor DksA
MTSLIDRKQSLLDRMQELDDRLHDIDEELEAHNSKDWQDLATEREEDEVLEGMGLSGLQEIRAIKEALKRIAMGTYGECVRCGERIWDERLDVLPYTPVCRTCAGANAKT